MIRYEKKQVVQIQKTPVAFQCDICKKEYTEVLETQEFHHIRFSGGFGSVFGDMGLDDGRVECDICQHCLLELIGDHYRIVYGRKGGIEPLTINNLGLSWYKDDDKDHPTECRVNPYDAVEWFDNESEQLARPVMFQRKDPLPRFQLNPEGSPAIGILFGTTPLILDPEIESGFVLLRYKEGTRTLHFDADPSVVDDPEKIIRAIVEEELDKINPPVESQEPQ